jgi:diacylglycerol kinase family enzyme
VRNNYPTASYLAIQASEPLQVNLDGEPLHGRAFHFQILERSLPFYLPPTAPLQAEPLLGGP